MVIFCEDIPISLENMFQVIIAAEKDVIFINFILVLQIRK
jgi:hypothetical protein